MFRMPVYVPAGKPRPVVSICRARESECVELTFPAVIGTLKICRPVASPLKGLVVVNGCRPDPFGFPETLLFGMLLPAPFVSAVVLEKYANRLTLVRVLASAQLVVMLTAELPADGPLGCSVKFTVAGAAATVSVSFSTAFRFTLATFEFSACPYEADTHARTRTPRPARYFDVSRINPPRMRPNKSDVILNRANNYSGPFWYQYSRCRKCAGIELLYCLGTDRYWLFGTCRNDRIYGRQPASASSKNKGVSALRSQVVGSSSIWATCE